MLFSQYPNRNPGPKLSIKIGSAMEADIFDMVVGRFMDGTPLGVVPKELHGLFSIRDNLTRLFNASLGRTSCLPGYGLPEFNDVYTRLPENLDQIASAMKKAMAKWEPRIKQADLIDWSVNEKKCHLECVLVGTLESGELCRFFVKLRGMGGNRVEFLKKK